MTHWSGIKRRIQTQNKLEKMESREKSPSVCASLQISFPASGWEIPFGVVQYWLMPAGRGWKRSTMLTLTNPSEPQESNKHLMCDKLRSPFCYFHSLRYIFGIFVAFLGQKFNKNFSL